MFAVGNNLNQNAGEGTPDLIVNNEEAHDVDNVTHLMAFTNLEGIPYGSLLLNSDDEDEDSSYFIYRTNVRRLLIYHFSKVLWYRQSM